MSKDLESRASDYIDAAIVSERTNLAQATYEATMAVALLLMGGSARQGYAPDEMPGSGDDLSA